jgi:hypothetical protein
MHILRNLPCEDSSASYSSDKYHIAVVADGHGARACFRSAKGAKLAAEVAVDCLKQFADAALDSGEKFYEIMFSDPRFKKTAVRHLTDTIIADWYNKVTEDYECNPPSAEEAGDEYNFGDRVEHIYGTTLIAALWLPGCLLLLQQGDGRCDVFFRDGSISQPIPWDKRCIDFTTTSMCDEDVAVSIRSCMIDIRQKPVAACYLGCDGVEDAYRDTYEDCGGTHSLMGGVHTFYKEITRQINLKGIEKFEKELTEFLEKFSKDGIFSRTGSGDDISIAGIVDLTAISDFIRQFEYDINFYSLEEKLFWKKDELRGKTRKHDILRKRMEQAEDDDYENAKKIFIEYDEKYCKIEDEIAELERELKELPEVLQ